MLKIRTYSTETNEKATVTCEAIDFYLEKANLDDVIEIEGALDIKDIHNYDYFTILTIDKSDIMSVTTL